MSVIPKIAVICPTRSRPHNIIELRKSWLETTMTASDLIIAIDDDDVYEYLPFFNDLTYEVNPRLRMCPTLNLVATKYAKDYEAVGFVGDDHRFRTPGWDVTLLSYLKDKNTIAYGNDLLQGELLATAVFMNSNIINTIGYMVPPKLVHMYADNFWMDLGNKLETIKYFPDIIVEHCHPAAGKAETDAQYAEVDRCVKPDEKTYRDYKYEQFQKDVDKLVNS